MRALLFLLVAGCVSVSDGELAKKLDQDGDGAVDAIFGGPDCDATNPDVHPDAEEIWYDGVDQNCDGASDHDQDGDGWRREVDCDDTDAKVFPGAREVWYDDVDQDCAGDSDHDQDHDGVEVDEDCDDTDASSHPGASEVWYDGTDQDCLGGSDFDQDGDGQDAVAHGGTDCDDLDATVFVGATEVWYDDIDQDCSGGSDHDQDGDGQSPVSAGGHDCDDLDPAVFLGAVELCNGIDDDCDGLVDLDDVGDPSLTWWTDLDGDGFGEDGTDTFGCGPFADAANRSGDCDDADRRRHPGAAELCDGVDNDCSGTPDDARWFQDLDGDGFGAGTPSAGCPGPGPGWVLDGTDCDDTDADAYVGQVWGYDADGDGYGATELTRCARPVGMVLGGDCDDADDTRHPGAIHGVPGDYATIDAAVAAACSGSRIEVAAGTYTATATIPLGNKHLELIGLGGVAGTVFDAQGLNLLTTNNGIHIEGWTLQNCDMCVQVFNGVAVVRDVSVNTAGRAVSITGGDVEIDGLDAVGTTNRAVFVKDASTRVTGSRLVDGSTAGSGAGLYVAPNTFVVVEDTVFDNNVASSRGGGVHVAGEGELTDVVVTRNAGAQAGGLAVHEGADVRLTRGVFVDNSATRGGGILVDGLNSNTTFFHGENVLLVGNQATVNYGAALVSRRTAVSTLSHATVVGNQGTTSAAIYNSGATLHLDHVVFSDNTVSGYTYAGGAIAESVAYSNAWNNSPQDYVSGDETGTDGNISVDPGFVSFSLAMPAETWDLHLRSDSPLVDAGDPNVLDPDGTTADIGAFGGPNAVGMFASYSEDADSDGLPDVWEATHSIDTGAGDGALDPDQDGLDNAAELDNGTDPMLADTDGDGVNDGDEIGAVTDPLDPASF